MSPQRVTQTLFKTELRTIIVAVYAVGLLLLTVWTIYNASKVPSRTDLQKVVIALCESVNEGHNRSNVQAGIIADQAHVINNFIKKATNTPSGTPAKRVRAAYAFRKFVFDQEADIVKRAGVFKNVKDTNCNEAK